MKYNESKYPTQRILRCTKCGAVFVASIAGAVECPECESAETGAFDGAADDKNSKRKKH
jgi:uncharacterized Zn finger protein (UPF0148 family)